MNSLEWQEANGVARERLVLVGEILFAQAEDESLCAQGLGSCVAVGVSDVTRRVCGMAHVQLPETLGGLRGPWAGADQAVPELQRRFEQRGGQWQHASVWIAGGQPNAALDIGTLNLERVRELLPDYVRKRVLVDCGAQHVWVTLRVAASTGAWMINSPSGAEFGIARPKETMGDRCV